MISKAQFNAYNKACDNLTDGAKEQAKKTLAEWLAKNPNASFNETYDFIKAVLQGIIGTFGDAAASLAAEWYDAQMEYAGAKLDAAITVTTLSQESLKARSKALAAFCQQGKLDRLVNLTGTIVDNEVRNNLNATILANAKRDRKKGVRFARVTTGLETCTFCMMLASRGAVYHSRKSAGEFDHWHDNCHCKVIPSYEADPMATLVEGHSPKEAKRHWLDFLEIDGEESLTEPQREAAKKAILEGALDVGNAIAQAKEEVPTRTAGRPRGNTKSKIFKEVILPKKEYATVTSAINTNYSSRFKGKRTASIIVDQADGACLYTFLIDDFGEYKIIGREPI